MIPLTLAEVASAVGGAVLGCDGTEVVSGSVEFDSRRVGPGGLFVAVPGQQVDGHDFAAAAVAAGAVGVLAGRPVDAPAVLVPAVSGPASTAYALAADADGAGAAVLAALAELARAVVERLSAARTAVPSGLQVVSLTGSSGKTSTKDMVAALLAPLGPTVAPPGSFNNELGHPWTALRADERTRHLVLELSARGPGQVAALCRVAPPSIGVVLNVGSAHLGEFGSRDAVATAKGELVEALPPAGVAVLNADDAVVAAMDRRTAARVVRFGWSAAAAVRAVDVALDDRGCPSFRLVTPVGEASVRLAVPGEHQVSNALAAVAVALELGGTPAGIAAVLERYRPASRWRMEVTDRPDGVTVVNDAYNANPESVAAALRTLVAMAGAGRRSWAVLGPVAELGEAEVAAHREIGTLAVRLGVDRLVVVGEQARPIAWAAQDGAAAEHWAPEDDTLRTRGRHTGRQRTTHRAPEDDTPGTRGRHAGCAAPVLVPDVPTALELLRGELTPGDVVLVKASRAYGLERVAAGLLAAGPDGPDEGSSR